MDNVVGFTGYRSSPILWHLRHDLVHFAADFTNNMLVLVGTGIVSTRALAQLQFPDQLFIRQVTQGIINGPVREIISFLHQPVHDIRSSRMIMRFPKDIVHRLALRRQI